MQKLSLLIFFFMVLSGASYGDNIPGHSDLINEIINIHNQMTEIDRLLEKDPENQDLQHTMKKMKEVLVSKMRQYNIQKRSPPQKDSK